MDEFPKRLRKLRGNTSQYVLAQLCGIRDDDSIRKYENGVSIPRMDNLIRIANHFEVSIDYLVGRTDNPFIMR